MHPAVAMVIEIFRSIFRPIFRILFAPRAQRTVVKTTILSLSIVGMILTSMGAYLLFYNYHVPQITHLEPIWLQYGGKGEPEWMAPRAMVDLTRGNTHTALRHEQVYDISIRLHVPNSDSNFNIGNFMITLQLQTANHTNVLTSSRASILRYQSSTQRILHVLSKALPLLLGWTEESQIITVPMVEGYIEQKTSPVAYVTIALSNPSVQVYDAQLRIIADLRGLRYHMYYHRIITAFVFALIFSLIELVCAVVAWRVFGQGLWNKLNKAFAHANPRRALPTEKIPHYEEEEEEEESDVRYHDNDNDKSINE
ncbi:putative adipose-regulatory protein-domain-containing protein [Spinellus fusiger]|nr:putative adipose-regulatory protein-domain-containing protein [Spinellus fusiger]